MKLIPIRLIKCKLGFSGLDLESKNILYRLTGNFNFYFSEYERVKEKALTHGYTLVILDKKGENNGTINTK